MNDPVAVSLIGRPCAALHFVEAATTTGGRFRRVDGQITGDSFGKRGRQRLELAFNCIGQNPHDLLGFLSPSQGRAIHLFQRVAQVGIVQRDDRLS